jgi:pyrroline-5-carboxylate reductase
VTHPAPAIGVVGVGAMGGAMVAGLARHARVVVEDQAPGRAAAVAALHDVEAGDAAACDVVIMAVKPQDLGDVLASVVPRMPPRAVLASVAAGWPIARLADHAPDRPLVRLMPNLAVAKGHGLVAMASRGLDDVAEIRRMLAPLGTIAEIDESLFPVATAIGGSGPGFIAYIAAAMEQAGIDGGLPGPEARSMVQAVLAGTASLLADGGDPALLQQQVTSPGGTTAAGISVMEAAGVAPAVLDAVHAAATRAGEL